MENHSALENMVTTASVPAPRAAQWRDKRIFITGHTGFVGSWLSLWLKQWGARLYGYSLAPETPSLFQQAGLDQQIPGEYNDIRDLSLLTHAITQHQPEIVFHLAAQPLVRLSYEDPITTYATNVLGTAHVLEATRKTPGIRAIIVVTSDKCYDNDGSQQNFRENDRLGGHDPYSNSKACAELVCQSYRASYFSQADAPLLATARAGNIIGGGDWAKDRLIPDAVRAFAANKPLIVRYPDATRPWQHVLEAVNGYLTLAEALLAGHKDFADAWNFGPNPQAFCAVQDVAEQVVAQWGSKASWQRETETPIWREAPYLALDINKATKKLGWRPKLTLAQAIEYTVAWYKQQAESKNMLNGTIEQINSFISL